ncbi:MAG TPA: SCE4755 family polysaccharide monooxygenase-like protein [Polyangiaceae bacterium]|jgi:hypothetical protein|nr:SCE4755 family polysaccharide monooxygenase-like protein [Polyangiaceae bacterium]
MALPRSLLSLGLLIMVGTLAAPSRAHIDLRAPTPRVRGVPDTQLSLGPCGQRDNARNPERVTRFEPGQTIDVEWDVYVQHVSYFRLAFDLDGDDSFSDRQSLPDDPATDDPTALPAGPGEHILGYLEDPTGDIDHVERRVTLPDEECERCTLQLIQFTYGLPLGDATYYQCADLVLRRSGAQAADAGAASGGGGAPPSASAEARPEAPGCALPAPGRRRAGDALLAIAFGAFACRRFSERAWTRSTRRAARRSARRPGS